MQESKYKIGDIIKGFDGDELIVSIEADGRIYTLVLTDDGNSYKPKELDELN